MNNFDKCFQYLLVDEGGYTNDSRDSGGATNLGITIYDYRKYIKASATPADVKTLTTAQAKTIYRSKYWDACGCDKLPSGVDNAVFNYGVLAGIGRPLADLKKFSTITDQDKLIDAICDEMKQFLNNLATNRPKDEAFRAGWNNRVVRLRKNSHYLAANKDNVSGPTSGLASGFGIFAALSSYIHTHPYGVALACIATVAAVWAIIHYVRNKK